MNGPQDKSPADWEAWRAIVRANAALIEAQQRCEAAHYGSEVLAGLGQAREGIAYALRLVEGKA